MKIDYIQGDATYPIETGSKILVHICNDSGVWGAGFVLSISKRWKEPEQRYRKSFNENGGFNLGEVQFIEVEKDLLVANLIGQHGIKKKNTVTPPIRYEAVKAGLEKVAEKAQELKASVHLPKIGTGLAGGKWEIIEKIIEETLLIQNISVRVYEWK